ncbi:MAG: ABATE domain-containing protein [Acidobacteriota bacterium]
MSWLDRFSRSFLFVGNSLCLDLVNTELVEGGRKVDRLDGFESLAAWLVHAGTFDSRQVESMLKNWRGSREANELFTRALGFRACLHNVAERIAAGRSVPQTAVGLINEFLSCQSGSAELKRTETGFEKHFRVELSEPRQLLWPVAESACDLLCYGNLSLVRKCENPNCVLFFYDTTRNHSRRWCSMSVCGNRMKVAAHFRRLRSARQ